MKNSTYSPNYSPIYTHISMTIITTASTHTYLHMDLFLSSVFHFTGPFTYPCISTLVLSTVTLYSLLIDSSHLIFFSLRVS